MTTKTKTTSRNRPSKPPKWSIVDIIDGRNLRVQLTAAHYDNVGNESATRKRVLDLLHGGLFRGRMIAQERLEAGADGLDTARLLSAVMDEVLSALYDYTTTHIFRARNPTEGERMAVLAVGGYGRSALAPSSDVDILFVRTYKETAWSESVIEYMLYALWDLGLKVGHAFRTIDECIRLSREDVTIRTAVLDRRFLFGDRAISQQLDERFKKDVIDGRAAEFVAAKLEERAKRHAREGGSRFKVEPNVKEGKGGLRDLQTLFWLAKFIHGGFSFDQVLGNSVFSKRDAAAFRREARFLWTVRCHLHYLAGRAEDRLSFDFQPEMARRMSFEDKHGMTAVERFMKRYFLATKEVGSLTRILCAQLEAAEAKKPSGLMRFMPPPSPKPLDDPRFVLDGGRVSFADQAKFTEDPLNLLRLFKVADEGGYDIHPEAMGGVRDNLHTLSIAYRKDPLAQQLFLSLAASDRHPGTSLKLMNETGVLGRFLPEFGRIVGQTQFNMYHHYTVDEHTLKAVECIHDIEIGDRQKDHPLSSMIFPKIEHRRALYLAILLHDTGKGQGDQQVEGAKAARRACIRLGLGRDEAELVAWLVGNHLEMSDCAQRRDISDPRTISDFAKRVGSVERLRLLLVLTVADIRAVGPDVWNAWKGQLLRELYHATEAALRGGRTDEASIRRELASRARQAQEALQETIGGIPKELEQLEDAYWTAFDADVQSWHARLVDGVGRNVTAGARVDTTRAATELAIHAPDRPGLFADLCTALTAAGANILAARLFSGNDGCIFDIFDVQDDHGDPLFAQDPRRMQQLIDDLNAAARGSQIEAAPVPAVSSGRRQAAFIVEPVVSIDRSASRENMLIEISGRDRPALMQDIARSLFAHGLSITSAHGESHGMRASDVFYVQPFGDQPLDEKSLIADLKKLLLKGEPKAPRTPAHTLARAVASDDR